jgi:hypothetical protein
MNNHEELLKASQELNIESYLLPSEEGLSYIDDVFRKYNPHKTSGHLSIYPDSVSISLGEHEFTYPRFLTLDPVYVFSAQEGSDAGKVVQSRQEAS